MNEEGAATRFMAPSTYQIGDADATVDAVLAGFGVCQMPLTLFRRHIKAGRLVTVLDEYTARTIDVHAVWPCGVHPRPKVRYVVDARLAFGRNGKLDTVLG